MHLPLKSMGREQRRKVVYSDHVRRLSEGNIIRISYWLVTSVCYRVHHFLLCGEGACMNKHQSDLVVCLDDVYGDHLIRIHHRDITWCLTPRLLNSMEFTKILQKFTTH